MARTKLPKFESRDAFYEAVAAGRLTIPDTIRSMRGMLGVTQKQYAKMVGVSEEAIRRIEQSRMNPTAEMMDTLGKPFRLKSGFVVAPRK
ncbi:helix-turn-helix domain-containing protein [Chitinimonas sp. PSY-7]|uniref:helix-turn-helix domain-containing protein n=1 Tax=Chitinimonas sp. PSY-7 TaxID=3459088 RepID=UPI0040403788